MVVPTYGRPDLLWACLHSIAAQDDPDFDVIVADDASPEPEVAEFMTDWMLGHAGPGRWINNFQSENVGSVRNIHDAIRSVEMAADDVIFLVDGDDQIPPNALSTARALYERTAVVTNATYGSYVPMPPDDECPPAWRIPSWVLDGGPLRDWVRVNGQAFNHPLTFRRWCFDRLTSEDLHLDGEWMRYGYDMAYFVPILEMCGNTAWFCPDPIYYYTSNRGESVARAYPDATSREYAAILSRGRAHEPIA